MKKTVSEGYDWGKIANLKSEIINEQLKNLNEYKAFGVNKVSNAV